MTLFLAVFGIITGLFTIVALGLQAADWSHGRGVTKSTTLPIEVRRSLSHNAYIHGIETLLQRLTENHFRPNLILAVNYGGLSPAAEIALKLRIPVIFVEVALHDKQGTLSANHVILPPELAERSDRAAFVVDNSIRSGTTLAKVLETVRPQLASVKSCVVYRPTPDSGNFCEPDFYIFASNKSIQLLK